ncbi:Carboxypeptidase B [Eumeta japonica]|uniref:Carboxypeptidase B n=1 Tax=Eumeta variegata TaxID=151549 RepID=A0A4C1WKE1_EUMVA|nr:Carboxypeptidase B [Eumeta japonica]
MPSAYYEDLHNETIEEDTTFLIENDKGTEEPEEVTITPRLVPGIRADDDDDNKVDYTGAQVWQVNTNKTGVRAVLYRLRRRNLISTWGGNQSSVDILIKPQALGNVSRVFKRENIVYNIIIDDLQQRINEENPPLDENELELQDRRARSYNFWRYRATRRRVALLGAYMGYNSVDLPMEYWRYANWGHLMTWKQYHRLDEIYGFLNYLAKTYPALVTVQSIGKSHQGNDLKVLKISNGDPKNKAVFIDGGIHAREWISPATVTYFINQIAENFDIESDDIKNIDWYFMPVVNPDGYEFTHTSDRLWRKNRRTPPVTGRVCSGIDLNRNFGYKWGGKGSSNNPCSEIYGGRRAFSEPESKALADFITNSATNFSAYLTYHSYGQYLLYPWGYENVVPPDYQDLDKLGKKIAQAIQETGGSQYKVGSSSGLLYPASGGSDDWAKAQGIKYSYTIELSDTGRHGFILPTSYIEPVARESLAGLRVLANQLSKE